MSKMRFGWMAWLVIAAATAVAADPATNMPSSGGIKAILGEKKQSADEEFLPPDEAFQVAAVADGPGQVRVEWVIHEGYYLYKSRIKFATPDPQAKLGTPSLPTGKKKHDEYFGDQEVYHDEVAATVPVTVSGSRELPLDVTYQGCAEAGLCYPPITKNLKVSLGGTAGAASGGTAAGKEAARSAGSTSSDASTAAGSAGRNAASAAATSSGAGGYVSEQDFLAGILRDGSLIAVLAYFFVGGLLLSFTPCVLPMIPILSGIIVGQGEKATRARSFSLAFSYVQGMALTYAAVGAVFALLFKQAPQAFFQQPWIKISFALLFVALALAMFGAYTLQLPSSLQTRLTGVSNKQKAGTYGGTFIMGALSALVVTACVAPALIAALTVISQTGQVARGAAALYATGIGMGVPLLLVGASAGELLPKVGPWMDTVKSLFGVVFLGVAVYFMQPLLPAAVSMLLWSALAVISGYWIFSLKARDGGPAPAAIRAPGLLAMVYGIILLIGVAAGGSDPLQPLGSLRLANSGDGAPSARASGLTFETIKSVSELEQRVAAAAAAGKPVMLDFYADWCVSCKEMEKYTFTDRTVQAALSNAVLLRADVTRNDAEDQALLQHFGIFGPPTIAFYDPAGQEQRNFRVVGYMKAPDFAVVLRQAFAGGGANKTI